MRLPRDISGERLARLLRRYGYDKTRETGSHSLTLHLTGHEHHVTIPKHDALRLGTLADIVEDVAEYLGKVLDEVADELFNS